MNKSSILSFCLLALSGSSVHMLHADDTQSRQMTFGYSIDSKGLNLGLEYPTVFKCAIQIPASEALKMKGSKITAVRLALGDNPVVQKNYVFISDNLDNDPLYTQDVEKLSYGWNEISLDTPFEITGSEFFVGYRYESQSETMVLDGEKDNNLANWLNLSNEGAEEYGRWAHQSGGSHKLQLIIEGDNLPQNDVAIYAHSVKSYASTTQPNPLGIVVRNMGAATVTDLDFEVTVDGESVSTHHVDNLSIPSNALALVSAGELEVNQNNIFDLGIKVTAVNGCEDEDESNNSLIVKNVISKKDYVQRKVLLEHFSTMKCSNCPSAHNTIDDALRFRQDVVHVVYHAGFSTDKLTIPEAEAYLWLYFDGKSEGSYYAPGASLDRTNMASYGATDGNVSTPGPAFLPRRDNFSALVDRRLSTAALATIDIDYSYDPATRQLRVKASGYVAAGSADRLKATDPRVTVMLTEDGIEGEQKGVTEPMEGPYIHDKALRCVLSDTWGDPVTFNDGAYATKEYTTVIPAEWDDSKINIVAFLSDFVWEDTNKMGVYNAEEVKLEKTAGLDTPLYGASWMPVIADGHIMLPSGHNGAKLYNLSGAAVAYATAGEEALETNMLQKGVYILRVEMPREAIACKVLLY